MPSSFTERQRSLTAGRRRAGKVVRCALTAACLCSIAPPARAQVDDSTKSAARQLGHKAAAAFDAGDYATAQDLFHRAYALVQAPTLALREARALERLGRLVEAEEAYVRATRTKLGDDAPDAFREAVRQAHDELRALHPRVPNLRILLSGDDGRDVVSVIMDSKPVRAALLGVDIPVDPGDHDLTATSASGATAHAHVTVREGDAEVATLTLARGPAPIDARPLPPPVSANSSADSQRIWAYVGLGVGGAGLGTGVITGLLAASRHSSAEDNCPDGKCTAGSSGAKDLAGFRSLRTVSTVSYLTGIAGVGAGLALMLTIPKDTSRSQVRPYVGIGRIGVQGRF